LSHKERGYLRSTILKTVEMFANNELGAWGTVFSMLDFPYAKDMMHDVGDSNEISVYTDSVEALLDRIGLSGQRQSGIQNAKTTAHTERRI